MEDLQTQMKIAVAKAAVDQIEDGMVLGLGSGSTAALMIKSLGGKAKISSAEAAAKILSTEIMAMTN